MTLRLSIGLLSGAALAYEVILVRLLAMTRFHHLAFMVLSLALLAYGASGVLLAYRRAQLLRHFRRWFGSLATLFALSSVICFQLSQRIQVSPAQWLWSPAESLNLVLLYLILSLPLLAAATAVGLAYCHQGASAGRLYRADLMGAAAGSLGALLALWLPGAQALWLPWCGGCAAAALMAAPRRKAVALLCLLLALLGPALNPRLAGHLQLSPHKSLAKAMTAVGSERMADLFTPVGRLTVIRNTVAPYRQAPGLSLAYRQPVSAQWGLFSDGDSFEPLPTSSAVAAPHLDHLPEALAYYLAERRRVLILDPPIMEALDRALQQGADRVSVVVSNPGWRRMAVNPTLVGVQQRFARPNVALTVTAPRGYLRNCRERFDLIVLGSPAASALTADYRFTVEAFREALRLLPDHGLLSVSGPSDLPPRTGLRLFTTALTALQRTGAATPGDHLILIRSLRTVHLLIAREPLSATAIDGARRFCQSRRFDPVWFPGMAAAAANRWNRLATPVFHEAARALLGPTGDAFQRQYKFDISPVTDDRPYFSRFIKPATLVELLRLRHSGSLGLLSLAEPVLSATLIQAVLLAALLIWLPLRAYRPKHPSTLGSGAPPPGGLFFLLGAGFMLAEFAVLQQMVLYLNEPTLAVGGTLAAFLTLAGIGGGLGQGLLAAHGGSLKILFRVTLAIVGVMLLYLAGLPALLTALVGLPFGLRLALLPLILAPLAMAMGLPFPMAIARLHRRHGAAIPWAWGLNGCGALVGPVAGMGLAVYGGVRMVLVTAALCYGAAALGVLWRHKS